MKNLRSILEVARALHNIAIGGDVIIAASRGSAAPELEEATLLVQEVHESLVFEIQRVQAKEEKRRRPDSDYLLRQAKPQTDRLRTDEALSPNLKQQLTEISLRLERLEKRAGDRDVFIEEINRLGQRIKGMAQQIKQQRTAPELSPIEPAVMGKFDPTSTIGEDPDEVARVLRAEGHGTCFECGKEIQRGMEFVVGDEGIRHVEGSLACR